MKKDAESKVRRLTSNQAKVLKAIVFPPSNVGTVVSGTYISTASGLTGNALGGTVSALERSGTIQPFGREKRQFNWELIDPDLKEAKQRDPRTLKDLLKRIAGDAK
ncbi:hypothetical protein HYU95_04490 [Candidatus Daviesbacteria bacterium]|nr:hypothetical protein [Candidatus Daviesbacteria bacterium]